MSSFPSNSRYAGVGQLTWTAPDGTVIAYLERRFVPAADTLALLREHVVADRDRLDNLAALYLGDPLVFWQICDANDAMRPEELTETVGRRLRITLPQGVPGTPNG